MNLAYKNILFAIAFLINLLCEKSAANDDFDHLIFTQRWLPSACIEYKEKNPSLHHDCNLPENYKIWTIHGLWPTQENHMGPFFCNTSIIFDINKLKPIEPELMSKWPNIEKDKDFSSLWQHEWEKHGTCAAQLESFNSEFKYFYNTLKLFNTYDVQNVLLMNNILPSKKNDLSISHLFTIFKSYFGKTPQIHCIHEVQTMLPYLSEIRFCLNKNIELIDCLDGVHKADDNAQWFDKLTNCPLNEKITYPDSILDDSKLKHEEL